jgi:hypothetical protein
MSYGADDSYKIDLQTIGGLQRFFRKYKSLCAFTETSKMPSQVRGLFFIMLNMSMKKV